MPTVSWSPCPHLASASACPASARPVSVSGACPTSACPVHPVRCPVSGVRRLVSGVRCKRPASVRLASVSALSVPVSSWSAWGAADSYTDRTGRIGVSPTLHRSVVPSQPMLLSCPGLLLAHTASARPSVQPASSGRPSSPGSALPGRQPRRRSPVRVHHALSTHPVSSSGIRQSSRPVSSPSGVRPRRSGRVRLLRQWAVALGSRPVQRGTRHHRNRSRSRWAAAPSSGSVNGQQAWRADGTAEVARWSVGGSLAAWPDWVRAAACAR
jgi:hypothetical protein